jgi:hypothetical protein
MGRRRYSLLYRCSTACAHQSVIKRRQLTRARALVSQNELILTAVLDAAFEAISSLLRKQLDRRTLLDNLELVLLAVDELIDCGVILEIDQKCIKNRVLMQDTNSSDPNIGDMTISEAFEKAKEQASTPGFWSFGRKAVSSESG